MLIWITLATALLILVVLALRYLGDRPISYRGLLLVDTKRFLESFLLQMGFGVRSGARGASSKALIKEVCARR